MKIKVLLFFSLLIQSVSGATTSSQLEAFRFVPEGWKSEIIPFPMEFALGIPLNGTEELLFSPDMYHPHRQNFFSYLFSWNIKSTTISPLQMKSYLTAYYQGLANTVSGQKNNMVMVNIVSTTENQFQGSIQWTEPFVTHKNQLLRFKTERIDCAFKDEQRWYFYLSPQDYKKPVWDTMKKIEKTIC